MDVTAAQINSGLGYDGIMKFANHQWARLRPPALTLLTTLALLPAGGSVAAAEVSAPFVMPDLRNHHEVGGGMMYGSADLGIFGNATLFSFFGQYRRPITDRLGFAATLPIAYASGDLADGTSLGNLTFETSYLLTVESAANQRRFAAFRASLSLPTASDGGNASEAALAHAIFYVPDPGLFLPDTTTLRLSGDYRIEWARAFFQANLGLDVLVISEADDVPYIRLGLAGGFTASERIALVAELTNMSDVLDDSGGEDYLHTLDLGLNIGLPRGHLALRLYFPLDDSRRDLDIFGVGFELFRRL